MALKHASTCSNFPLLSPLAIRPRVFSETPETSANLFRLHPSRSCSKNMRATKGEQFKGAFGLLAWGVGSIEKYSIGSGCNEYPSSRHAVTISSTHGVRFPAALVRHREMVRGCHPSRSQNSRWVMPCFSISAQSSSCLRVTGALRGSEGSRWVAFISNFLARSHSAQEPLATYRPTICPFRHGLPVKN
jgi:hypothetical protein